MPVSNKTKQEQAMQTPKPVCVACGDTGINSKGEPCVPCQVNGRVVK